MSAITAFGPTTAHASDVLWVATYNIHKGVREIGRAHV